MLENDEEANVDVLDSDGRSPLFLAAEVSIYVFDSSFF